MIASFRDTATEDLFNGRNTRAARARLPRDLWRIAARRLDHLDSATRLEDLRTPPGNRLEALRGDRAGQHSIRVNIRYRVCFRWSSEGPSDVELVDYH